MIEKSINSTEQVIIINVIVFIKTFVSFPLINAMIIILHLKVVLL